MVSDNKLVASQPQCPLFGLPAELRNAIYQHALIDHHDTRIQLRHLRPPALLSTCRRIRYEASTIYFSINRFVLTVNIPPMAFNPDHSPRVHRVFIPAWISAVEENTPLHMRDVKVEIDHAWKFVVITMSESNGGRLEVVEAWLHNGRQKLPLGDMRYRVKDFVDWTIEQKTDVEEERAGLNYRDVIMVASKMLRNWAGTIIPVAQRTDTTTTTVR